MEIRPCDKVRRRVHEGVSIKLEHVAMKLVRTSLHNLVDGRPGVPGELRIERTDDHVFFLKRIRINLNALALEWSVIDIDAIQKIGVLRALVSIRREAAKPVRRLHYARFELLQPGG